MTRNQGTEKFEKHNFYTTTIINVLAFLVSIAVMILTCNQNTDQYNLARDAASLSEKQFDTSMADRSNEDFRNHYRDSVELDEFVKSFELSRKQFNYQTIRDSTNFSYQQQINKRWLALLDSQSINTSEALKFQKQLIDQNLFVNAPYVQVDSVLWNSNGGTMSIYMKNFGNRPAQITKVRFSIISPENQEVVSRPLDYYIVVNPSRSEEIARAKVNNPKIIFNGTAYFRIQYTVTDFRGDMKDHIYDYAYHFDFVGGGLVMYARLRLVQLDEALKAMERTLQTSPDR